MNEHFRSLDELIAALNPDIHSKLKRAVELGRWENGDRLSPLQREHCMQAIIAWELKHLPENERTGYIDTSAQHKTHCDDPVPEQQPLTWVEQTCGGKH